MTLLRDDEVRLETQEDIVRVRQQARQWAVQLGFSLVDQTKIVTAASELARNTILHGRGGTARLEALEENGRRGLRLTFADHGPGIADLRLALEDGYTTAGGLGLGLGGARRLMNEFSIDSRPGAGTTVSITRWH